VRRFSESLNSIRWRGAAQIYAHSPQLCGKIGRNDETMFDISARWEQFLEGSSYRAYIDDSIAPTLLELYSQVLDTTPQKRVLVCWEQSAPASPTFQVLIQAQGGHTRPNQSFDRCGECSKKPLATSLGALIDQSWVWTHDWRRYDDFDHRSGI
jgi:hypothetical protein